MIKFYQSRLYNDSKIIERLEKEFAQYTGFTFGVACNSCTNAIYLCLAYEREFEGRKTITIPDRTYVSVAHTVVHTDHNLKLDPFFEAVGHAYHLKGSFTVDSAHEVDRHIGYAEFDNRMKFCYSFYPTKLCPSYEGGMICTNDEDFVRWARTARQMGRTGYGAFYDVVSKGWKMNMNQMQAKEALKSLRLLPKTLKQSQKQRDFYNKYLSNIVAVDTHHIYSIKVEQTEYFIQYMKNCGIECSVHFYPISSKTAYGHTLYRGSLPTSLPLHPYLTRQQQKYIIDCVLKYIKED